MAEPTKPAPPVTSTRCRCSAITQMPPFQFDEAGVEWEHRPGCARVSMERQTEDRGRDKLMEQQGVQMSGSSWRAKEAVLRDCRGTTETPFSGQGILTSSRKSTSDCSTQTSDDGGH